MEMLATRCPWYVAGPAIGLLIAGLFLFANRPLGMTGAYEAALNLVAAPRAAVPWRALFWVGVALGGAAFAALAPARPAWDAYPTLDGLFGGALGPKLLALGGGGVLMGFGARTGGGCTSGHGMTGMALASPASIASTMVFMAAAVATSHALFALLGGQP